MKISKEYTERWKRHDIRFQPRGVIYSEHTGQDTTTVPGIRPYMSGRVDDQHRDDRAGWNHTPKGLSDCT